MEFEDILNKRQSVRNFKKENVSKASIDAILLAGMKAPVAMGQYKDYLLKVVQNEELSKLQENLSSLSSRGDCTYGAPLVILVLYKNEMNEPAAQSVGCIIENMSLKSTELDLGSVYVYSIKNYSSNESVRDFLNIGDYKVAACLAIGKKEHYQYINKNHKIEVI